jgi:hypothetical protein
MAHVVERLNSSDLIAVATWLSTQSLPQDTSPARTLPARAAMALPDCGSAPELKAMP